MASFEQCFETRDEEIRVDSLPVAGDVPAWLSGTLVRNGPAQYEVGEEEYRHWFDGLAMLHAFGFEDRRVSYANRYLRSPAYEENNAEGRITYSEYATDPCRDLFSRVFSFFTPPDFGGNANVNVTRLADEYIARTEYPMSVKFDPNTLETLGIEDHEGTEGQITTAHPHRDTRRDTIYNYRLELGRESLYRLYGMTDGEPRVIAKMPLDRPSYIHSFGMSERFLILAEFPLKLGGSLDLAVGSAPFIERYEWMPEEGTRITVFDKDTGERVARSTAEPFFAFHHVNAFEREGELVMDIAAFDDPSIIDEWYIDRLTSDDADAEVDSRLRRYRVPLDGGRPTSRTVSEASFDLPRFDYERRAGHPYRFAYGAGTRAGTQDFFNQLVKLDVESGGKATWHEEGTYPGEPVFIAAPEASDEDEGVVLSVVLDGARHTSFLVVLDAKDLRRTGPCGGAPARPVRTSRPILRRGPIGAHRPRLMRRPRDRPRRPGT